MNIKIVIPIFVIILSSCNSIKDDFFDFLFGTDEISLNRICSNNSSELINEGRFFETYSVSEDNIVKIIKSIKNYSVDEKKHVTYSNYKIPEWKLTPVLSNDSVLIFLHEQMIEEKNNCFDEESIKKILQTKGNYYTSLYDNLGRVRLFILNTKNRKLFLITSYIL
jgi:hypothetical protein